MQTFVHIYNFSLRINSLKLLIRRKNLFKGPCQVSPSCLLKCHNPCVWTFPSSVRMPRKHFQNALPKVMWAPAGSGFRQNPGPVQERGRGIWQAATTLPPRVLGALGVCGFRILEPLRPSSGSLGFVPRWAQHTLSVAAGLGRLREGQTLRWFRLAPPPP